MSVLTRFAVLLGQLRTVSEGRAGRAFDLPNVREDHDGFPPGLFSEEKSLHDEWDGFLHKVADVMEADLERHRGRWPQQGRLDADNLEWRIRNLYQGRNDHWIAYIEGLPSVAAVIQARQGKRAA